MFFRVEGFPPELDNVQYRFYQDATGLGSWLHTGVTVGDVFAPSERMRGRGKHMKLTQRVVLGATALLLAYEFWTLVNRDEGDTISESIWDWSQRAPFVAFAAGLLCGHFFWPHRIIEVSNVETMNIEDTHA